MCHVNHLLQTLSFIFLAFLCPLFPTLLLLFFESFLFLFYSSSSHLLFYKFAITSPTHLSPIHSMFCPQKRDYSLSFFDSLLSFGKFFFFFWILSCTFSLGWSGLVLRFLITPSSLSWLWFNFFVFFCFGK